jgi:hypothetical protein
MRPLVGCVLVVALFAIVGLTTGVYGAAYTFFLLSAANMALSPFIQAGLKLPMSQMNGLAVVFWLDLLAFAIPAFGLYLARKWLRRGYLIAITSWTVFYAVLLCSGTWIDWP